MQASIAPSSVMSHSTTSLEKMHIDSITSPRSFFDRVFPFFNEVLKTTSLPDGLVIILTAYQIYQMMVAAVWPGFTYLYDIQERYPNLNYIFRVAFIDFSTASSAVNSTITDTNLTNSSSSNIAQISLAIGDQMITFIIFTVLIFLSALFLCISISYYFKTKKSIKWTFIASRIILQLIPKAIVIPLASLAGNLFLQIIYQPQTTEIIYFFFTIIFYFVILIVFYFVERLSTNSPFLSSNTMATFHSSIQFYVVGVYSLFTFVSYILMNYAKWMHLLLAILFIVYCICLMVFMFTMPYMQPSANGIINGVLTSGIFTSFGSVLAIVELDDNFLSTIIISVCTFIGGCAIFIPIMNTVFKRTSQKLMFKTMMAAEEEENAIITDEMKHQWLDNLKVDKYSIYCNFYIHIGLMTCSDFIVDFSLLKYCFDVYQSYLETVCFLIQVLALFPSEIRLLKLFFAKAAEKFGHTYAQRFLLFQVNQIMSLRQSSASAEIREYLINVRHLISKGITGSHNFWKKIPNSPDFLYQLRTFTEIGEAELNEAMSHWPNNVRLVEEYLNFLVEIGTDFENGVKMKNRINLIEQGKNFVVDYSFRSLIHIAPNYLKQNLFDIRGYSIVKKKGNNGTQTSSNGQSTVSSGTIDGELDIEVEETLAKQMFSMHRLRLAFQRAFENRKSPYSSILKSFTIFGAIILLGILLFLYINYYNRFDIMQSSMNRLYLWSLVRYGIDAAITTICFTWIEGIGEYSEDLLVDMKKPSKISNKYNLNFANNLYQEVVRWQDFSYNNLESFLASALDLAASGVDVRSFMYQLTDKLTPITFCSSGRQTSTPTNQTLKVGLYYLQMKFREVSTVTNTTKPDPTKWRLDDNICILFSNLEPIATSFDDMVSNIRTQIRDRAAMISVENKIIGLTILIGYSVITIPTFIYLMYKYYQELRQLLSLMTGLDPQIQDQASKPFKYDTDCIEESSTDSLNDKKINIQLLVVYIMTYLVIAMVLMLAVILCAGNENSSFLYLNEWLFQSIQRSYHVFEAVIYATFAIVIQKPKFKNDFINLTEAQRKGWNSINSLKRANGNLLKGSENNPPCVGLDTRVDYIHFSETCDGDPDGTFHDTYRCGSLENLITIFISLVTEILRQPELFSLSVNGSYYNMVHSANAHLVDLMFEASELLNNNAEKSIANFRQILLILLIIGIFYSCLSIPVIFFNIGKLDKAYQGGIQLLRHIPPIAFSSNKNLMNFLLHKKETKNDNKMTAAKSMIHMSKDSVFCLNKNESIEVINLAVTDLFGYTPDQLLGQSISCILPEDTAAAVYQQMHLMKNGQCSMIYETDVVAKSDDDTSIPVHATVLGIAENGAAKSFAVVLRDQTLLQKHKEEAEAAKDKSERLLYQILPRDIVVRLNKGETDISFSVPSASIIFIDIVRWSDYSATLSPTQIMANLTIIFSKFDSLLSKYPLITKIKLIGDVFMAAAGLFTPEEPPQNHASQVVSFGLDSLVMLEDANSILESNLQARVGVNTDGPLIAGILGTDKPTFDIIGDPINVSARLQSTCIPSTVQISKTCFELIADMNFNIEPRGEIELKGKGKRMAYIVRQPVNRNGSFFLQETA